MRQKEEEKKKKSTKKLTSGGRVSLIDRWLHLPKVGDFLRGRAK